MDIDLNLLRIFDTLFELRSVTRAADRLGVTQSAVSHALGRLRKLVDDPLFARSAQGLQPTTRALEMAPAVREGLGRLRSVLLQPRFEEAEQRRRFTIAAGHYFCSLLIPPLMERVRIEAPGVSFAIVPIGDNLVSALDNGTIDLAFGAFSRAPGRFEVERLFEEEMVWISAAANPLTRLPFDPSRISGYPRVVISARTPFDTAETISGGDNLGRAFGVADGALTEETTVYDSMTAIAIVAGSDMVALVPRKIAERELDTVTVMGPGGLRPLSVSILWHSRHRSDPALSWLRSLVRNLG